MAANTTPSGFDAGVIDQFGDTCQCVLGGNGTLLDRYSEFLLYRYGEFHQGKRVEFEIFECRIRSYLILWDTETGDDQPDEPRVNSIHIRDLLVADVVRAGMHRCS